ncbi:MAG: GTPase Era [Nitrosomonas sp.]|nr:MAG: GTPase Era [Nitrosomonas sp.]
MIKRASVKTSSSDAANRPEKELGNNTPSSYRSGYIAIIGRPNVGKSTLLNHLIGQKVSITSKKAQTTRHRINGILTDQQTQFVFVDTPGFQTQHLNQLNSMMNRAVIQSLSDVDVVLFVIEALRFDDRDSLIEKILPEKKPVILIINKIDKIADKKKLLPFLEKMAQQYEYASMIPVSAEQGIQLPLLLDTIRSYLPEGRPLFGVDEVTDRSERFVAAELLREKLFRMMGDEIPYATSVIIEQFKQKDGLRKIYASILVDNANQKAIVIGKDGLKLKEMATQARKDMEDAFGSKVFLNVWVKVRSGWADDASVLRSLGYE